MKIDHTVYKVGQILFVISSKTPAVIPVRVIEEVVVNSLDGKKINYVVSVGENPTEKMDLEKIQGEVYTSADEVYEILKERSRLSLEQLVNKAIDSANTWYGSTLSAVSDSKLTKNKRKRKTRSKSISNKPKIQPNPKNQQNNTLPTAELPTPNLGVQKAAVQLENGQIANITLPDGMTLNT